MGVSSGEAKFSTSDINSGFFIFLIALPLCLGIALASGFPPIAGILTAIMGGVVVNFLGSARLTIKGPAAGLIVIVLGAVNDLGGGDAMLGYRRALAVGVAAAALQIVFALLRLGSLGLAMSPSVVHGMLAAIGVIIFAKQSHIVMGVTPEAQNPLALLAELPKSAIHANPWVIAIGLLSLLVLFGMPKIRGQWARRVPAPMLVLLVTVTLGVVAGMDHAHAYAFAGHVYAVGPSDLLDLPASLLGALTTPDFSMLFSPTSLRYIVLYALIGCIESTLSVIAVDSLDPARRPSNLNRDMLVVGLGNFFSAWIGGLPMISEIVRSKANIDAGAQSRWSNFFHGAFLLLFVALVPQWLEHIPLAALAAMLVFTGLRLASPQQFRHAWALGRDQLALFLTTFIVTLATDLLLGVVAGLLLKIAMHVVRGARFVHFWAPQIKFEQVGDTLNLRVGQFAIFASLLPLQRRLRTLPEGIGRVVVDLRECWLVDHTFAVGIHNMSEEWRNATLVWEGGEHMRSASHHPHATRWGSE